MNIKNNILREKPFLPKVSLLSLNNKEINTISNWTIRDLKAQIGYMHFLNKNDAELSEKKICANNYDSFRTYAMTIGLDIAGFPKNLNKYITS